MNKLITLFLMLAALPATAQKFDSKYISEHLNKSVYSLDSSADVIILFEKNTVTIEKKGAAYVSTCHVHRLYKILKQSGASMASIAEVYRNGHANGKFTTNLKAYTFNFAEDQIKDDFIDDKAADDRRLDTNYNEIRFSFPAVRTGSVLEYQYDITTPYDSTYPRWELKGTLPKLHTELEVTAPAELKLNELYPAQFRFVTSNGIEVLQNIEYSAMKPAGSKDGMSHQIWSKNNLPAFKKEQFNSNPANYCEVLELAMPEIATAHTSRDWAMLNSYMMTHERFGQLLTDNDARIRKLADSLTRDSKRHMDKAKSIYNYVRNAFECNNNPGVFSRREAGQIVKNKSASTAEINLVLCALLRAAGLDASPVLVSILGMPRVDARVASVGQFNYTVCQVKIDYFDHYLDGSNPFNCFGILPVFCYNGAARVLGNNSNMVLLQNKDFKDAGTVSVQITDVSDTTMHFVVTEKKGRTEAIYLRSVLNRDSAMLQEYLKKRILNFPGQQKLIDFSAENLTAPDNDLIIHYTINTKFKNNGPFSFPTDILKIFSGNPFQAPVRILPVEFPSCHDYNYSATLQLPADLKPVNLPPPASVTAMQGALKFSHRIDYNTALQQITVQTHFSINEPTLPAAKYEEIKGFFDNMTREVYANIAVGRRN